MTYKQYSGNQFKLVWRPGMLWYFGGKPPSSVEDCATCKPGFVNDTYMFYWIENTDRQPEAVEDIINKPKHYHIKVPVIGTIVDNKAEIDCWAVLETLGFDKHHYIASAFQYIFRCLSKDDVVGDLKKAIAYLQREVNRREGIR